MSWLGCRRAWRPRWFLIITFRSRVPCSHGREFLQCLQEIGERGVGGTKLALPDDEHGPAGTLQRFDCPLVPFDVALELGGPEVGSGLGQHCIMTAWMAVPEAAMYKYTGLQARQYNVRSSGKIPAMQPIPVSIGVQESAYQHLRLRVLPPDGRHHPRSSGGINDVHFA